MPMIDAMSRIQEIRSTLNTLSSPVTAPPAPAAAAAGSVGLGAAASGTSADPVAAAAEPGGADLFTRLLNDAAAGTGATKAAGTTPAAAAAAPAATAAAAGGTAAPAVAPGKKVTTIFPAWATPAAGTTVDNPRAATGADVVAAAKKYLGVPYVWGGNDPKKGLDCSSLVQTAFRDLGIDVPRVVRYQMSYGTEVNSLAEARPGDLIVTRGGQHIGIYLGDNKLLHAPRPGEDVQIREMFEKDADITSIRRIVPADGAQAAPAASNLDSNAISGLIAAGQSSLLSGAAR